MQLMASLLSEQCPQFQLDRIQEAIQMSQALEESMRMYEEENRRAPPDESLAVRNACCGDCQLRIIFGSILCLICMYSRMLSVEGSDGGCKYKNATLMTF